MTSKLNSFFCNTIFLINSSILYDKWNSNTGDLGIYFLIYVFEISIVVTIFLICGLDKNQHFYMVSVIWRFLICSQNFLDFFHLEKHVFFKVKRWFTHRSYCSSHGCKLMPFSWFIPDDRRHWIPRYLFLSLFIISNSQ